MSKRKKKSGSARNRVDSNQEDFTGRLFGDALVSRKLDSIYILIRQSKYGIGKLQEIEGVLDDCSATMPPDYEKFYSYLYKNSTENRDVVLPRFEALINRNAFTGEPPLELLIVLLYREYKIRLENTADENNSGLRDYVRFKLLFGSVLRIGERFVRAMADSLSDIKDGFIDEGLEGLDYSQLKDRFLKAILRREKSAAFKLLGRLSNLDPGESSYFEALAHVNSGEYDDAIRFAKKILPGNADYPGAAAMILNCLALKGNYEGFSDYLSGHPDLKINTYYLLYLIQVLICNTQQFDQVRNGLEKLCLAAGESQLVGDGSMGIMAQSNLFRNSARLAVERIELLEDIELYGAGTGEDMEIPDELGYRYARVSLALSVHPDLASRLAGENMPRKEISRAISEMLLNNYNPVFEDYYEALTAQHRLGESDSFIGNMTSNAERLLLFDDDRAWNLIEAAYVESIIRNDGTGKNKLQRILTDSGRLDERKLDDFIGDARIKNGLSSPGKIAYTSAEWQYRKAMEEDYGWKDAGMLSLAYFRIIELELNRKIVVPAISAIGVATINRIYNDVLRSCSIGRQRDEISKRWNTIVGEFRKIDDGTADGLMLGPMEFFFTNLSRVARVTPEPDNLLTQTLYDGVKRLLSPQGTTALDTGRIKAIISNEKRNRFRNPPAHTKYLGIEVAKQCKQFVDSSLLELFTWTV